MGQTQNENLIIGSVCLVLAVATAITQILYGRHTAREMGEAYHWRQGLADTFICWHMLLVVIQCGDRAKLPFLRGSLGLGLTIAFGAVGLAALVLSRKQMTAQRYTAWKMAKDTANGSNATRDAIRNRQPFLILVSLAAVMLAGGIYLASHGISHKTVMAVVMAFVILVPMIFILARKHAPK